MAEDRLAILEEENRQLRLRIEALSSGPSSDERHALALHLAFRKAAEIPQAVQWPKAAQEAWALLYEAVTSDDFGLALLKGISNVRDTLDHQ